MRYTETNAVIPNLHNVVSLYREFMMDYAHNEPDWKNVISKIRFNQFHMSIVLQMYFKSGPRNWFVLDQSSLEA